MWRMFHPSALRRPKNFSFFSSEFNFGNIRARGEVLVETKVFCSNKYFAYFRCRISEFLIKFPVFTNEIISVFPPARFWCEDDDSGMKSNFRAGGVCDPSSHTANRVELSWGPPISNVIISQYCGAIFSCRRSMRLSSETCRKLMQFYDEMMPCVFSI